MSDYGHNEAMRDLNALREFAWAASPSVAERYADLAAYIEKLERELGWANVTIEAMHDMSTWDAEKEAELASLRSQHERDEAEKLCLARMCVLLKVGGTLAEIEADPDCLNGILEWAQRQAVSDISAREEAGQ